MATLPADTKLLVYASTQDFGGVAGAAHFVAFISALQHSIRSLWLRATPARFSQTKVTTEGNVTVIENEPATVETIGGDTSTAVEVLKKPRKAKAESANASEKKLSCVAAALKVLGDAPCTHR